MPLPAEVDIDKVASIVWDCTKNAIKGWLRGRPLEEGAFVNRLTEQLSTTRRGCDVGLAERVVVKTRVAVLHRKGPNATDLYGSDLAVTIIAEPGGFTKTALFQVKKGTGFSATLERKQLLDALANTEAGGRSFVLYVDEDRPSVRIQGVREVLAGFQKGTATLTTSVTQWMSLHSWLTSWLGCSVGTPTDLSDPNSIETLLAGYEVTDPLASTARAPDPLNSAAWLIFGMAPILTDLDAHALRSLLDPPSTERS